MKPHFFSQRLLLPGIWGKYKSWIRGLLWISNWEWSVSDGCTPGWKKLLLYEVMNTRGRDIIGSIGYFSKDNGLEGLDFIGIRL